MIRLEKLLFRENTCFTRFRSLDFIKIKLLIYAKNDQNINIILLYLFYHT